MRLAGVVTASNRASAGVYQDTSGQLLSEGLADLGFSVIDAIVVPDEMAAIQKAISNLIDRGARLVVTTGGTGISPRDVTPEATAPLLDRMLPGIPEALRAAARDRVPTTDLSRGLAGISGRTLVVNLPGSPGAVRDGLAVLGQLAGHVIDQLDGVDH
jgi:molybdenum cofactor biosynthesis protein B